ncbi:TetR/AcrR family transcriptional regulator [Sinorhizobium americanum]|nr:TetR/AcrR family transcriptional regulator [Sinorhizobium americanum]
MDAAEERIRRTGYSGFSFREIAADVGVKSASVHYHFPTKEKLAAAVARRYTDRFLEAVDHQLAGGEDIVEAWRQVFRVALQRDGRMCPAAPWGRHRKICREKSATKSNGSSCSGSTS